MVSLKEKYKKPEPFMKWLRKTRNRIFIEKINFGYILKKYWLFTFFRL